MMHPLARDYPFRHISGSGSEETFHPDFGSSTSSGWTCKMADAIREHRGRAIGQPHTFVILIALNLSRPYTLLAPLPSTRFGDIAFCHRFATCRSFLPPRLRTASQIATPHGKSSCRISLGISVAHDMGCGDGAYDSRKLSKPLARHFLGCTRYRTTRCFGNSMSNTMLSHHSSLAGVERWNSHPSDSVLFPLPIPRILAKRPSARVEYGMRSSICIS
jgi:hypothetical protein